MEATRGRSTTIWVAVAVWLGWLGWMLHQQQWELLPTHWPMALTMTLGSFVAGATSEGGGAVAFPVMTLLLEVTPPVARDFSLAIQSVGMTAASITIFALGVRIERTAILHAGLGGALGVVLGMELIAPRISGPWTKIFFVSVWLSFACALWMMNRRRDRPLLGDVHQAGRRATGAVLLVTGLLGGCVSGVTGSGLDIVTFAVLVLAFRIDERIATPTSVVLMASNSLCGVAYRGWLGAPLAPAAIEYFWVCVPVVVLGAPLGAHFIRNRSRRLVVSFLYGSIGLQYLGAMWILTRGGRDLLFSAVVLASGLLFFYAAAAYGRRSEARATAQRAAKSPAHTSNQNRPANPETSAAPLEADMDEELHDCVVIGAGPAGLQLGYFLERAGRDYVILERNPGVGSFFERFPRNRRLISFNKRHSVYQDPEINLRWDWNSLLTEDYSLPFREFSEQIYPSADEMVDYLRAFYEATRPRIRFRTEVSQVTRQGDGSFVLQTSAGGRVRARALVVATGLWTPYVPDIPGIELAEGYESASFEGADYTGQRLLVIGKGNSGFELADRALSHAALIHLASPESVQLAWQTRHAGHVRGHYTAVLDSYQLKTLNGALDCHIEEIRKQGDEFVVSVRYLHADGEREELVYDRVVRATGFRFDDRIFDDSCRPRLVNRGRLPDLTPCWESATCPQMFFAGTLMQTRDFKRSASAFIDGFRYNIRSLFHMLEARLFGVPLPSTLLPAEDAALAEAVMQRVCRTSSLWTQFGHLADAIVVDAGGTGARYHVDLPYEHARDSRFSDLHVFTVTFEWGQWKGDVFAIDRHPSADTAYTNVFLHPIVRHFFCGQLRSEHHILEDLMGMYDARWESGSVLRRGERDMARYHLEEHLLPLQRYFHAELDVLDVPAPLLSDIRALGGAGAEPAGSESPAQAPLPVRRLAGED